MRYLGGKHRQSKDIERVILEYKGSRSRYVEPFIGGGSVLSRVAPHFRTVVAADASESLVALWREVTINGWIPPEIISKEEWRSQKASTENTAMKAWAGYAASYNGKWFAGYGPRASGRDYLAESARGLIRKADPLRFHSGLSFIACDYSEHLIDANTVVYCDPPYAGTEQYGATGEFDHTRFWSVMDEWVEKGALVLVHEYTAPDGWVSVLDTDRTETMHHGGPSSGVRKERLFMKNSG
ncbi:DNA adenine methylase [Nocardia nova]|uniref:DNA adenine methylase n=1 Tax=Nocardia nova TaxID=37330 RepID=UPI00273899ED|nr:DNA adenine methylase [Nocardia nova]